jgi:hypothetical protein
MVLNMKSWAAVAATVGQSARTIMRLRKFPDRGANTVMSRDVSIDELLSSVL